MENLGVSRQERCRAKKTLWWKPCWNARQRRDWAPEFDLAATLGLATTPLLVNMAASRVRSIEPLLKFKIRSLERRKSLYKNLITALVQHERLETTLTRCQDLSRVAERVSCDYRPTTQQYSSEHAVLLKFHHGLFSLQMIDLAKKGQEEEINGWLTVSDTQQNHAAILQPSLSLPAHKTGTPVLVARA